jgi:alkylation response protein AidB-like acyl-CoA dehydrogenase
MHEIFPLLTLRDPRSVWENEPTFLVVEVVLILLTLFLARSIFQNGRTYFFIAVACLFGGALIDEPTIRFTLADMATALETSRLMLWRAASALDNNDPDKVTLCAMAKRYVTDTCFDVADDALQLLGGYGYLREYGLEKIVRDLRVHRILEGTNEIMRVVIGRAEAVRARAGA